MWSPRQLLYIKVGSSIRLGIPGYVRHVNYVRFLLLYFVLLWSSVHFCGETKPVLHIPNMVQQLFGQTWKNAAPRNQNFLLTITHLLVLWSFFRMWGSYVRSLSTVTSNCFPSFSLQKVCRHVEHVTTFYPIGPTSNLILLSRLKQSGTYRSILPSCKDPPSSLLSCCLFTVTTCCLSLKKRSIHYWTLDVVCFLLSKELALMKTVVNALQKSIILTSMECRRPDV